jgi:RNA polymerase sigma factor (sigma-70 family)
VVRLRFESDFTQQQIGDRVGISQMQVSRILRRCLGRLQACARSTDPGELVLR